jgi:transcriptional/translational regulatory protein YebC/TACO1
LRRKVYDGVDRLPIVLTTNAYNLQVGFPKASIEAAVARGQGVSITGAALETLTLEALLDSSVALVIDIMTDNRKRTLSDLRLLIKNHGGTVTPTSYLFQKRGKVLFDNGEKGLSVDEVLDEVIEAEAEDVDMDTDSNIVVWTEPSIVTVVAEKLSKTLGFKVKTSGIIWHPNEETLAPLGSEEAANTLSQLIDALQDNPNVQGVFVNVARGSIDDRLWSEIREKINR